MLRQRFETRRLVLQCSPEVSTGPSSTRFRTALFAMDHGVTRIDHIILPVLLTCNNTAIEGLCSHITVEFYPCDGESEFTQ